MLSFEEPRFRDTAGPSKPLFIFLICSFLSFLVKYRLKGLRVLIWKVDGHYIAVWTSFIWEAIAFFCSSKVALVWVLVSWLRLGFPLISWLPHMLKELLPKLIRVTNSWCFQYCNEANEVFCFCVNCWRSYMPVALYWKC